MVVHDYLAAGLSEIINDPVRVLTEPAVLDRLSHDFDWYSPVLRPLLAQKNGDVAVRPVSVEEVLAVLRFAGERAVPVTVRGAGTGNYGQCVPLEGGIVLDLALMDKLEEITSRTVSRYVSLAMQPRRARNRSAKVRMGTSHVSVYACQSIGGRLPWRRLGGDRIGSPRRPARLRQRSRIRGRHHGRSTAYRAPRRCGGA